MEKNSTWRNSPLLPNNWSAESFRAGDTLLVAAGAIGIILVTLVLSSLVLKATGAIGNAPASGTLPLPVGPLLFVQLLFYIVVGAYLFFALPPLARRSLAELGLRAPGRSDAVTGLIGAAVMLLAVYVASLIVQSISHHEQEQTVVQIFRSLRDPKLLVLFAVTAVAFAPFIEELVFRAFLFNAFIMRTTLAIASAGSALVLIYAFNHITHFGAREVMIVALMVVATIGAFVYFGRPARVDALETRIAAGALCSGVLFGVAHGEIFTILPLTAGGMVLALTYYRSGSLWSSVIAHACFNTVELIGVIATNATHAPK